MADEPTSWSDPSSKSEKIRRWVAAIVLFVVITGTGTRWGSNLKVTGTKNLSHVVFDLLMALGVAFIVATIAFSWLERHPRRYFDKETKALDTGKEDVPPED